MAIKKILLLATPAYTFMSERDINPLPPMGLGYLASVVRNKGIEVRILDCLVEGWDHEEPVDDALIRVGLSDKDIKDRITGWDPDLIGINCQFSRQYKIYHRMLSLVKETKPSCVTVAGGAHATVCPDELLQDPSCDYVLTGEAEESFSRLIDALNGKSSFEAIDGLGRRLNGQIVVGKKCGWIADLDSIPFPAYDLMGIKKYFGLPASHGLRHKERFSPVITSRGCPAKCTFCSALKVWGNKYRLRSVENVLREMRLLKKEYGIEEIMFEDDNVTANPGRAKELFSAMISENFNFSWDTPNGAGVWSIDKEMLELIKASGCVKLNFPVESGSQRVLDEVIKKPLNLGKVKELIGHCRKIGLDYGMFLVIGMPGETLREMWESFKFAASCRCFTPHVSVATPYPGTELFDECVSKGYFARPFTLDDLFIRSFLIKTPEWDGESLKRMLSRGILYLKYRALLDNPSKIFRVFFKYLTHPGELLRYFKEAA
jgi:anaerobic magnesium-protoporphyrin IX monomethyl ester cyclase